MRPLLVLDLGRTRYREALALQEDIARALREGSCTVDRLLVTEHEPVFTIGKNGRRENLLVPETALVGTEVVPVSRGGDITWHGPGQLVLYPLLNLKALGSGVKEYVNKLEAVMLAVARALGVAAGRDARNAGIWAGDTKLGSIGIAVSRGITLHGLALNVTADPDAFAPINPCGMPGVAMGSLAGELAKTGGTVDPPALFTRAKELLIDSFLQEFGMDGLHRAERLFPGLDTTAQGKIPRKPAWLRRPLPKGNGFEQVRALVARQQLHTVCQSAACPNQGECFSSGTATFLIMGPHCTRTCRFCNIDALPPLPLDPEEPARVAAAVRTLGLKYAVVTSVTRDDLPDGGAAHFATTIRAIRTANPGTRVEVLIPDFRGDRQALATVLAAGPDVCNHNLETVPSLYATARPQAIYERSLQLFREARMIDDTIPLKSGLMLGLGETVAELDRTLQELRSAGCGLLTLGQYLQPSLAHLPVRRFWAPEEFAELAARARALGFTEVAAAPLVRSSYRAEALMAHAAP